MSRHSDDTKINVQIPVNTRAVGEPSGSYLLYLEDYVHTFIRKIYEEGEKTGREGEVYLYGYEFEEQGRNYLIVSGAIDKDSMQVSGERFFPSCYCMGEARVREGKDTQIALEVILKNGRRLVLDDFYIYYDQNEEMQNYLIEWNINHNRGRIRNEEDDSVRFGRMVQACNKEEVRVNYLWNAMNLLSLGLIVCIMAFGIICVNNYHKMKDMESKIAYVLSLPEDVLTAMNQQTQAAKEDFPYDMSAAKESEDNTVKEEITQTESASEMIQETSASDETMIQETGTDIQSVMTEADTSVQQPVSETSIVQQEQIQEEAVPVQYYIVQQGDTLRSISFRIYGTYSKVPEICEWNGIEDADSILYGQKLLLH